MPPMGAEEAYPAAVPKEDAAAAAGEKTVSSGNP